MTTRSKTRAASRRRPHPSHRPEQVPAAVTAPAAAEVAEVALTVTIDADRARRLWIVMAAAGGVLRQPGRFQRGSGEYYHHDLSSGWDAGRAMWCDTALDAMVLADYERACGYQVLSLWDLAYEPGHVVVSTRPAPEGTVPANQL